MNIFKKLFASKADEPIMSFQQALAKAQVDPRLPIYKRALAELQNAPRLERFTDDDVQSVREVEIVYDFSISHAALYGLPDILDTRIGSMEGGFSIHLPTQGKGTTIQCTKQGDKYRLEYEWKAGDENAFNLTRIFFHFNRLALQEHRLLAKMSPISATEPQVPSATQKWNEVLHNQDRSPDRAIELIQEITKLDPNFTRAYASGVYIYREVKHEPQIGLQYGLRFYNAQPRSPELVEQLGRTFIQLGNFDSAFAVLTSFPLEQSTSTSLGILAVMYRLLQRPELTVRANVLFMLKAPRQVMDSSVVRLVERAFANHRP